MAVFNDGTGPALFIGGGIRQFMDATGLRVSRDLAKWNGMTWSTFTQLGNGRGTGLTGIGAMVPVESGPARGLYLGGIVSFLNANRQAIYQFAVWDGQNFSSPGDYLAVFPDVSGFQPALKGGPEALATVERAEGTDIFIHGPGDRALGAAFRAVSVMEKK